MKNHENMNADNEVDLHEAFIIIWNFKIFITIICTLGILLSLFYIQQIDKKYTSQAIFTIRNETPGVPTNSSLGTFSSLLNGSTAANLPIDQINGGIFIKRLDQQIDLQNDPFFNTHNPNHIDPYWKTLVKSIIKWENNYQNNESLIWQKIKKNYSDNIFLAETENGSLKISVTHAKADRSAEIANWIMKILIDDAKNGRAEKQEKKLSYLAGALADAQSILKVSESKLKAFTIQNNAIPLETFTLSTLNLNTLRDQLSHTEKMLSAIKELLQKIDDEELNNNDYLLLRKDYPIVDQIEFRRILGLNELISIWTWPERSTVIAVYETLNDRKNRLKTSIETTRSATEGFSEALEVYGELVRENEIAQATYEVLMEQVKAQSMVAGFLPDQSEIYNYASPPITPSSPNQKAIVLFGAVMSLIFSFSLAFIFSNFRNVSYSKSTLIKYIKPKFKFKIKTLKIFKNLNLEETDQLVHKKYHPVLIDLSVEIYKSSASHIVISSSKASIASYNIAKALACCMQSKKNNIAIIDFSNNKSVSNSEMENTTIAPYKISKIMKEVYILNSKDSKNNIEIVSQRSYLNDLQKLKKKFDLLIMCVDNKETLSSLRALEGQDILHITLAKTKRTKLRMIDEIQSLLPIQGLLYE